MTAIQEQAIQLIQQLPDEKIKAIITLAADEVLLKKIEQNERANKKKSALNRLRQLNFGLPIDFDPEDELRQAMEEKYGSIG